MQKTYLHFCVPLIANRLRDGDPPLLLHPNQNQICWKAFWLNSHSPVRITQLLSQSAVSLRLNARWTDLMARRWRYAQLSSFQASSHKDELPGPPSLCRILQKYCLYFISLLSCAQVLYPSSPCAKLDQLTWEYSSHHWQLAETEWKSFKKAILALKSIKVNESIICLKRLNYISLGNVAGRSETEVSLILASVNNL